MYYTGSTSCDHCGRAIKNIALVENTVTNEKMEIGLTCCEKLMKLNESWTKAMITEVKKYYKIVDEYNISKDFDSLVNEEIERYSKAGYEVDEKQKHDFLMNAVARHLRAIETLVKKTIALNNFSKSGLIQLGDANELKIEYNKFKTEYGFCGNLYKVN
jgi:hypothetical protein